MNCDQVFDILTRGPFPTGTACDTPVEAHLNVCRDCRRLAEALRPALELFQEAIGPEESRDLPGYWCAVATEQTQPAVSAREVTAAGVPQRVLSRMAARGQLRRVGRGLYSGADSSPGYGAQFTQISQEGRQLVYRYVRNREPLFHDDL